jgi:hypothetical protein
MELLTLLLLSTALVPVSCLPAREADRSEPFHIAISTTVAGGSPAGHEPSTPTPAPAAQLNVGNGAVMKPVLGRREALNLGDPNASPADTVILHPFPGQKCTTTLSETYGYPCSWDGTSTMYPSTTILFQQINCNGCTSVYVSKDYYYCPNQSINATLRAGIPSTSWSTICQPSAGLAKRTEAAAPAAITPSVEYGGAKDIRRSPEDGIHPAACPTTLVVQPVRSAGKTATTYASYTTTTSTVNCGGCDLVVSTALAGYGPPGTFETTTTLPVGAVTTYACQ